ncbi:unnamed protein product [Vitrella brassicaformis CCMP3155]|uniref:Alpha-galactosidase n=2 Tax=Vitrella brassicaformis TaxID=1169539 RepID=A0A0G4FBA6_VITBC|nr:unnamed protein product [Vitrella brassicaformis CCMP3155]|eukprot:CEM10234.1 unnamed protein product [Vitrella brassicaformis CCMP3155]
MGWNSWNAFGISPRLIEPIIEQTADLMVSLGLRDAGYRYLNIDDGWQGERDSDSRITVDAQRFPSGFKHLADYAHAKGLLFGLYSDAGTHTCGGKEGSLGYEDIDARTYADWGVDYLKYDNCFNRFLPIRPRFEKMRDALNATGRPIFYSLCEWGVDDVWEWGASVGNSWRVTDDLMDHWDSLAHNADDASQLHQHAGPGSWNDWDMLQVGNGGLRWIEEQAHFAMWCLSKSPLVIGTDLRKISPDALALLKNEELIAVHQDPLGKAARLAWHKGPYRVFSAPLADGSVAVVIWNRHTHFNAYFYDDGSQCNYTTATFPIPKKLMNHTEYFKPPPDHHPHTRRRRRLQDERGDTSVPPDDTNGWDPPCKDNPRGNTVQVRLAWFAADMNLDTVKGVRVRDMLLKQDMGTRMGDSFPIDVRNHGARALRLTPVYDGNHQQQQQQQADIVHYA